MPTIQERRHQELITKIERALRQRDEAIGALVKIGGRLAWLQKQARRYEKLTAKPKATEPVAAAPQPKPAPEPDPTLRLGVLGPTPKPADDLDIPGFLQRKREGDRKDAEARAAIEAEQASRKQAKARVRIDDMKAKQRGDTKRMPLTGKAALEAIRA